MIAVEAVRGSDAVRVQINLAAAAAARREAAVWTGTGERNAESIAPTVQNTKYSVATALTIVIVSRRSGVIDSASVRVPIRE